MADLSTFLSSLRDQLAMLGDRREALQSQLAEVEREHGRLEVAVSVIQERLQSRPASSASPGPAGEPSLAEQVLEELAGSSGRTRGQLLRVFRPRGVNDNTFSSCLSRMVRRGDLVKRGGYYLVPPRRPSGPSPSSADVASAASALEPRSSPPDSRAVDADHPDVRSSRDAAVSDARVAPLPSVPLSSDQELPLTHQILSYVETHPGSTRASVVRHFRPRGVKDAAVDTGLSGLKKNGRLLRGPNGVLDVPPASDVQAVGPDTVEAS